MTKMYLFRQERQANQIEANYEEYLDELEQVKANHCRFVQYENSRKSKLQNVERDYIVRGLYFTVDANLV